MSYEPSSRDSRRDNSSHDPKLEQRQSSRYDDRHRREGSRERSRYSDHDRNRSSRDDSDNRRYSSRESAMYESKNERRSSSRDDRHDERYSRSRDARDRYYDGPSAHRNRDARERDERDRRHSSHHRSRSPTGRSTRDHRDDKYRSDMSRSRREDSDRSRHDDDRHHSSRRTHRDDDNRDRDRDRASPRDYRERRRRSQSPSARRSSEATRSHRDRDKSTVNRDAVVDPSKFFDLPLLRRQEDYPAGFNDDDDKKSSSHDSQSGTVKPNTYRRLHLFPLPPVLSQPQLHPPSEDDKVMASSLLSSLFIGCLQIITLLLNNDLYVHKTSNGHEATTAPGRAPTDAKLFLLPRQVSTMVLHHYLYQRHYVLPSLAQQPEAVKAQTRMQDMCIISPFTGLSPLENISILLTLHEQEKRTTLAYSLLQQVFHTAFSTASGNGKQGPAWVPAPDFEQVLLDILTALFDGESMSPHLDDITSMIHTVASTLTTNFSFILQTLQFRRDPSDPQMCQKSMFTPTVTSLFFPHTIQLTQFIAKVNAYIASYSILYTRALLLHYTKYHADFDPFRYIRHGLVLVSNYQQRVQQQSDIMQRQGRHQSQHHHHGSNDGTVPPQGLQECLLVKRFYSSVLESCLQNNDNELSLHGTHDKAKGESERDDDIDYGPLPSSSSRSYPGLLDVSNGQDQAAPSKPSRDDDSTQSIEQQQQQQHQQDTGSATSLREEWMLVDSTGLFSDPNPSQAHQPSGAGRQALGVASQKHMKQQQAQANKALSHQRTLLDSLYFGGNTAFDPLQPRHDYDLPSLDIDQLDYFPYPININTAAVSSIDFYLVFYTHRLSAFQQGLPAASTTSSPSSSASLSSASTQFSTFWNRIHETNQAVPTETTLQILTNHTLEIHVKKPNEYATMYHSLDCMSPQRSWTIDLSSAASFINPTPSPAGVDNATPCKTRLGVSETTVAYINSIIVPLAQWSAQHLNTMTAMATIQHQLKSMFCLAPFCIFQHQTSSQSSQSPPLLSPYYSQDLGRLMASRPSELFTTPIRYSLLSSSRHIDYSQHYLFSLFIHLQFKSIHGADNNVDELYPAPYRPPFLSDANLDAMVATVQGRSADVGDSSTPPHPSVARLPLITSVLPPAISRFDETVIPALMDMLSTAFPPLPAQAQHPPTILSRTILAAQHAETLVRRGLSPSQLDMYPLSSLTSAELGLLITTTELQLIRETLLGASASTPIEKAAGLLTDQIKESLKRYIVYSYCFQGAEAVQSTSNGPKEGESQHSSLITLEDSIYQDTIRWNASSIDNLYLQYFITPTHSTALHQSSVDLAKQEKGLQTYGKLGRVLDPNAKELEIFDFQKIYESGSRSGTGPVIGQSYAATQNQLDYFKSKINSKFTPGGM